MDDRKQYYEFLEELRKSGITNMWGAAPFLEAEFGISEKEASDILLDWIKNYEKLSVEYGWRENKSEEEEVVVDEISNKELFDEDVDKEEAERITSMFDKEILNNLEHIWLVSDGPIVAKDKGGSTEIFDETDGQITKYADVYDWCETFGEDEKEITKKIEEETGLDFHEQNNMEQAESGDEEIFFGDSEKVVEESLEKLPEEIEAEFDGMSDWEYDQLLDGDMTEEQVEELKDHEGQDCKLKIGCEVDDTDFESNYYIVTFEDGFVVEDPISGIYFTRKDVDESLKESPTHEYRDEGQVSLGQVGIVKQGDTYIIFKDSRDGSSNKDSLEGLTRTDVKYIIEACKELLQKESK